MNQITQELINMTNEQSRELIRLARLDELDHLADTVSVPDELSQEQQYGALLMANQILKTIKTRKQVLRSQPTTLT